MATDEPIAVVGIGCRFPGGITTMTELWETLRCGMNKVSEVPQDRFDAASLHDNDPRKYGTVRNRRGGFVPDVDSFDAEFFGIYPAEASKMDPQQRLALEASVHALEDSGTPLEHVSRSRTGVFLGSFAYDYMCMQTSTQDNIGSHVVMGTSVSPIANRVSHRLDLRGPSITIDTACSSSLVALHLACQSLWRHESDAALAGGVNVILRPNTTVAMSKAGFLSPDGSCKSFDASANGYVRSEGAGMVFLKPLSQALHDKDRIYACIRGSLLNQDGFTPEGFTVPSLASQMKLLKSVYAKSNIDPARLHYVEAHGPGTPVGDPIEATALGQQLGQTRSSTNEPLWIGSVKGNFGHLEGAAGIIGFIKAVMVTFHGEIPPQALFNCPNPAIDFKALHLAVPTKIVTIAGDQKRLVGVNSFGAGGTNAHAILEEAPNETECFSDTRSQQVRAFLLSVRSPSALTQAAGELASHLRRRQPALEDIAYTLSIRRSRHAHTAVLPAGTLEELTTQLDQLSSGQTPREGLIVQRQSDTSPRIAFLFSGQGGQWLGMGRFLMQKEPVFRESLEAFDEIFTALAEFSIWEEINRCADSDSKLNRTIIAQPAITAIQIALARMLTSYGIKPGAVVGHSVGEIAAAHIAGALTLEEAVIVVYYRSQIQSRAAGIGTMLATGISSAEAKKLIQQLHVGYGVEIAAFNGPKITTLTGDTAALERVASELGKRDTFARFVNVDTPYHSRFMNPLESGIIQALSSVQGKQSTITLYSTVTKSVEPGTHLTGNYWFENIRRPVRYAETAARILDNGFNFLVEIGPHPVLLSGTKDIAESAKKTAHILPAMIRNEEIKPLSRLIGTAYSIGIDVDISLFNGRCGRFIDLPLYPFQRQPYWFEHPEEQRTRLLKNRHPFLGNSMGLTDDGRCALQLRLSTGVSPFLADHVVDGAIVFPMTGHFEAAYLAAKEHTGQETPAWLEDLRFESPLILSPAEDFAPQVLLEITSPVKDFTISTRSASSDPATPWQVCSRGRINTFDGPPQTDREALESVKSRVQTGVAVDVDDFYRKVEQAGIRYGEAFRGIRHMWRLGKEILSLVELPSPSDEETPRFHFHPALSDACLHSSYVYSHYFYDPCYVYLPYEAGQVHMLDIDCATTAYAHVQVNHHDGTFIYLDASIYSEDGRVLAVLNGMTMKRLEGQHVAQSTGYHVSFCPDKTDDVTTVEAEFQNVLILQPQAGKFNWLPDAIRRTFPYAQTHEKDLNSTTVSWKAEERGFQLDRRTLLVVPAFVSILRSWDHGVALEAVTSALVRVASWIHDQNGTAAVVVLTEGACMTSADRQCDPLSSSIEGATRVMANEMPRTRPRVIDLPLDWGHQEGTLLALLEAELHAHRLGRHETVVAIRPEGRFVRRVLPIDPKDKESQKLRTLPARGGNYLAEPSPNGIMEDILLRQQPPPNLGPEEVGIEVHAAGLNYKDVMNSIGMLSKRATSAGLVGRKLGMEVAGRVTRIGDKVRGIEISDPVMAQVGQGFGGFTIAHCDLVTPIPSLISFPEAAGIPSAFVTAYYALVYLGRLTAGESILIHSAAGGVGIAAIQIAKHVGARVYATAGSPSRRDRVANMGVEAVFNSRSPSFLDEIKMATGGRGVDVVLNSLTGQLLSQSVACLAPFGRFIEMGKTDIYRNMRLGLEQFGHNRSFFAIDTDRLAKQNPKLYRHIMDEVCKLFRQGKLVPGPIITHSITELSTALRGLSQATVIGKSVVVMPEDACVQAVPQDRLALRGDRSYLITGGASGLGLHLAVHLVERGARHLVLVSRTGPKTAEDHAIISDLESRRVVVQIETADVSNPDNVKSLLCPQPGRPPIAGVVHSAGIIADSFIHKTTAEGFRAVFAPKALGAWNLHQATADMDLDFFVLVSSVSSILAFTGQFSYAASNQFLDGLAHHRRACGLPAVSLNLGVLGEFAGMSRQSTHNDQLFGILESEGLFPMSLQAARSAFEDSIIYNRTQSLIVNIDWSTFLKAFPHLTLDGAFLNIQNGPGAGDISGPNQPFHQLSGPERVQNIVDTLRSGLAKIVGVDPDRLSETVNIDRYAFDSLTFTQFRSVILREFRIPYPLMRLFEGPSLRDIAGDLDGSSHQGQSGGATSADLTDSGGAVDELTALSSWFMQGSLANESKPRLVCFHSMGAGASLFAPYLLEPPTGLHPIAVELPGRGIRADEAVLGNMSEIVSGIVDEMDQVIGEPSIFWGHSFGGIIAFEVIRALRRQGKPIPHLVITGSIAPHLIGVWQKRDVLLHGLIEGYTPEYMQAISPYVDDVDLIRSLLPLMKYDAPLLRDYQFHTEEPLNIPITAFAARQDDFVYTDEVAGWRTQASEFRLIEVDGDHWFLHRNQDILRQTLAAMAC